MSGSAGAAGAAEADDADAGLEGADGAEGAEAEVEAWYEKSPYLPDPPDTTGAYKRPGSGRYREALGRDTSMGWRPSMGQPIPPVRCIAVQADGRRCGKWGLQGLDKCGIHVSAAPEVRRMAQARVEAARLRLAQAAPDAAEWLVTLAENANSDAVRLKAATEILDRAGVRGGTDLNVTLETGRDAGQLIRERLVALSGRINGPKELEGHGASSPGLDIIDAETESDPCLLTTQGDIISAHPDEPPTEHP